MRKYPDLIPYITRRLSEIGETPASMTEAKGWGASYIYNIINGQGRPSSKRCVEIAEFFGDDPNIILGLAGFYTPQTDTHDEYIALLNSLSVDSRKQALDYLRLLKLKEDRQS